MKFYIEILKLLFNKFILRKNTGIVIKRFCENMGIVYIKLAQILATQNYGDLFKEEDRILLSSICDDCNKIEYAQIEKILKQEYGEDLSNTFRFIDRNPIGSASISQVHRAILNSGEEVAVKVKRKDITDNIEKEIKRLKRMIRRFGRFVNIVNYIGGEHALDMYLKWILEETDFEHEKENILAYQSFANSVNNKIENAKEIKVPKIYEKYCTKNVIVMEFIKDKTINQLDLSKENEEKIITALNSYLKDSFYALLNNKQVAFHGDPHSGNIYIDKDGNIGFLDMGLVFLLTEEEAKLTRELFITIYSGNYEKSYDMIVKYGKMNEKQRKMFKEDIKNYCEEVKNKEITDYFMDLVNICLKYEFVPPNFLFCMAKAFVCLNGISHILNNKMNAKKLVQEQTMEYLLKRSLKDCKNVIVDGLKITPKVFENTLQNGVINTAAKVSSSDLGEEMGQSIENLKELLEIMKFSFVCETTN